MHLQEQTAGLWCQFVNAPAKHVIRKLVGDLNIARNDLDVFDFLAVDLNRFQFALVLMQQRYGLNER